nr:MAG TPA: hypothetical protein [Caudoviricetes sp.]
MNAKRLMLFAASKSLSWTTPQTGHFQLRIERVRL